MELFTISMKNINLKTSLYLILGLSVLVAGILIWAQDITEFDLKTSSRLFSKVVSIDVFTIGLFSVYAWKWKIFKGWLVPFPVLNGTWKGAIQTTWEDPITGKRPAPIPAIVSIKQSFFKISCVMRTSEMTSHSVVSDFALDKDNQVKRLVYTYDSNPKQTVKDRSPQHCGTMVFEIIENGNRKLEGGYWTGRKTTGHIEMEFWKKDFLDKYPEELGSHPVSAARENKS